MKGFTDKALIILPQYEHNFSDLYLVNLKLSIQKMCDYLRSCGITPMTPNNNEMTDELITKADIELIETIHPSDKLFVETNCMQLLNAKHSIPQKHHDKAAKKFPFERGQSVEMRFSDVVSRELFALNLYLKEDIKLIIDFQKPSNMYHKVNKINAEGQIYIQVNSNNFAAKARLGKEPIDIALITNNSSAHGPVYAWKI